MRRCLLLELEFEDNIVHHGRQRRHDIPVTLLSRQSDHRNRSARRVPGRSGTAVRMSGMQT